MFYNSIKYLFFVCILPGTFIEGSIFIDEKLEMLLEPDVCSSRSLCRVADRLVKGIGVDKDSRESAKRKAASCYKCAADIERSIYIDEDLEMLLDPDVCSPRSRCRVADRLVKGIGVDKDSREAAKREAASHYKCAADMGNAFALYKLGKCFEDGVGYQISLDEALKYYKLSMDQGCPEAKDAYNKCLIKNIKRYEWLANMGDVFGQHLYGLCLMRSGNEKNAVLGLSYIKEAADRGLPEAQYNYAVCRERGDGCFVVIDEALDYYKKAASQGDVESMFRAGILFEKDSRLTEALAYYERAAALGHVEAMFRSGLLSLKDSKPKEALAYFEQAAAHEYVRALFGSGCMLERESRYQEALAYYERAAAKGHVLAKSRYAALCRQAAKDGDAESQFRYGVCLENGNSAEQNLASKYFKKAAHKRHPEALYRYGLCLRDGKGVPQNLKKANKYFELASKQGYVPGYSKIVRRR
ncbi:MAG: sel1 repeat family protein [Holosporales bacterium]|jgi:TPR repeat protein|nr:sel1 repeat family protein [Holosporales bacterium]